MTQVFPTPWLHLQVFDKLPPPEIIANAEPMPSLNVKPEQGQPPSVPHEMSFFNRSCPKIRRSNTCACGMRFGGGPFVPLIGPKGANLEAARAAHLRTCPKTLDSCSVMCDCRPGLDRGLS